MPIFSANIKILLNRRLMAVLFLGFASGLPIALTNSTLQAWFSDAKVNMAAIGALSLLGIPYTLKFLWAPLMDHYGLTRFGKRRSWIILTQSAAAISLFLLAQFNPVDDAYVMGMMALLVAFFAASQDIAIDAYRTEVLAPTERGLGASYFVFTYRVAVLVASGLALVFADHIGWRLTYELMGGLILLTIVPTIFSPPLIEKTVATGNVFSTMRAAWHDFLQQDKVILLILFIIFYKLGDALALSLITPFLLNGLGFSLTEIGLAYKTVSFVAAMLGGLVGGVFLLRWQLFNALLVFGLAQAVSNLAFALLAMVGKHFMLMTLVIFIENFCSGLSTAAFFAFLMSLCTHTYSAAQYALLSAIASVGRVGLGPVAAWIVEYTGWTSLFVWSFVLCFPGLFFLLLLKEKVFYHASVATE